MSKYVPRERFQLFDVDKHLAEHPFPPWVRSIYETGFRQNAAFLVKDEDQRKAILEAVAAEIVKWLQTLPLGAEIGSGALAKVMAPYPDDDDLDETKWYHVLCNRIGDMRYHGMLDGYWHDVENKKRPTKPHKKYFNGILA